MIDIILQGRGIKTYINALMDIWVAQWENPGRIVCIMLKFKHER